MNETPFRLYGIFGFPLGHTLSPKMQEAAFRAIGLKAFYLPFEVSREGFRCLMRGRRRLVLDGFNVTVPYKEEVLRYLDRLSPAAKAIGAVNTVVRKANRWFGFNTDAIGFITSLVREKKFRPKGKSVLILGAGGSARAVIYALARSGVRKVVIVNRTKSRARKIVGNYRRLFSGVEFVLAGRKPVLTDTGLFDVDLIVNAASVGLKPNDPALISPRVFPKRTLFVDLIYNPPETRLLRLARQSGHRTLNGLGMLLYQGAEAFRLWTGKRPPVAVMRKTLSESLRDH